jgi:MoxR-like ATPase
MKVQLRSRSDTTTLAQFYADHLATRRGIDVAVVVDDSIQEHEDAEIVVSDALSIDERQTLMDDLYGLLPERLRFDPLESGVAAMLDLPRFETPPGADGLRVMSDDANVVQAVTQRLSVLMPAMHVQGRVADIPFSAFSTDGLGPHGTELVAWALEEFGVNAARLTAGTPFIMIRTPAADETPAHERFPVEVWCDDGEVCTDVIAALRDAGFGRVAAVSQSLQVEIQRRLRVFSGPFNPTSTDGASARLVSTVEQILLERGIDIGSFPVQLDKADENDVSLDLDAVPDNGAARIDLPINEVVRGTLRPYAGADARGFSVTVLTNGDGLAGALGPSLDALGLTDRKARPLPAPAISAGCAIYVYEPYMGAPWVGGLQQAVARHLDAVCGGNRHQVEIRPVDSKISLWSQLNDFGLGDRLEDLPSEREVLVFLPDVEAADGTLEEALRSAAQNNLRIHTPNPTAIADLIDQLRELGFDSFDITTVAVSEGLKIEFGGARQALLDRLGEIVESHVGARPALAKKWVDSDGDIWLYVPQPEVEASPSVEPFAEDLESGETGRESIEADPARHDDDSGEIVDTDRGFVVVEKDTVKVGDLELPRHAGRGPLAPSPASFDHFCLDSRTADVLHHVASAVLLREPCLLEGETSTSKTSTILFLASRLNQPVVRLNLNGQTDTGELIGRFVPEHRMHDLPLRAEELADAAELLEPETRLILSRAESEGRPLTTVEVQQVMANEKMRAHPWRWVDGAVVQAMKKGWWLLLDEINLAEPQILERLNSVLETTPTLLLSENDNSVIGPGGTHEVHPDFRIFATMNPAEYAGRSVLSPAYRDRWRAYLDLPRPDEQQYLDMLQFLVSGAQPAVVHRGVRYPGGDGDALFASARDLDHLDSFLRRLARFHAGLEAAVSAAEGRPRLGARRKERYVFSRRSLLSVMQLLASPYRDGRSPRELYREAIRRYYVQRVGDPDDRKALDDLLDAVGLGSGKWSVGG